MLDPLIHREDREVAGAREAPGRVDPLEVDEHLRVPVGAAEAGVDLIGRRDPDLLFRDPLAGEGEEALGLVAEEGLDLRVVGHIQLSLVRSTDRQCYRARRVSRRRARRRRRRARSITASSARAAASCSGPLSRPANASSR